MSFATCFNNTRGHPFFESEANVFGYEIAADANAPNGAAGQCDVQGLSDVPTTGFNTIDKTRPTLIRLSIAISTGATQIPLIFEGRISPFVYDARIVCFSDEDLVTYAGNLINCPNQQILTVLGPPRGAIFLGNDGLNTDWTEVADTGENPTISQAVYSTNILVSPNEYNITGGLFMVMNAMSGTSGVELRSAFHFVPEKSAIDYVCI